MADILNFEAALFEVLVRGRRERERPISINRPATDRNILVCKVDAVMIS